MNNLKFYSVDLDYVDYLKKAEERERGFSRVPNIDYGNQRKQKFLCGIVLKINLVNYFVPVSSNKKHYKNNFIIRARNGQEVGSLRFNFMFPVPLSSVSVKQFSEEKDISYKRLVEQEWRYCVVHQDEIRHMAERTYKRVISGKDPGLVKNSCDFLFLEAKCMEYSMQVN